MTENDDSQAGFANYVAEQYATLERSLHDAQIHIRLLREALEDYVASDRFEDKIKAQAITALAYTPPLTPLPMSKTEQRKEDIKAGMRWAAYAACLRFNRLIDASEYGWVDCDPVNIYGNRAYFIDEYVGMGDGFCYQLRIGLTEPLG